MFEKYNPQSFEKKWVQHWDKEHLYKTSHHKHDKKAYVLAMFPYPSGAGLHVGHTRIYTGADVLARYLRMKGYGVLHPMGWDAFGLPAENAAIKFKKNPQDIVPQNIANFKRQMQALGLSYDWDRELDTTNPHYYQWTQWLFIQFYKSGLLYKKDTLVYFCDFCKTGLAEEEVLPNGTHERCGNTITRKSLPQWIFQITKYAESLLQGLESLDWPQGIIEMQRNWIGKDKGLQINFKEPETGAYVPVWTKYWETIFGVTFLVLAPEHELIRKVLNGEFKSSKIKLSTIKEYVEKVLSRTDEQRLKNIENKTGIFTGLYATNPVNGKKVPIWIADYVLANVGTGAVMGVPAHDQRDFEFAKKYTLPVVQVVHYKDSVMNEAIEQLHSSYEGPGTLINSSSFNSLEAWGEGKDKIAQWLIAEKNAQWQTNYHLRDWIFSRQRYWGEPIPMVYCEKCAKAKISWWETREGKEFIKKYQNIPKINQRVPGSKHGWFPLNDNNLPLKLPYLKSYEPTGTGESPLVQAKQWITTSCPHCGNNKARRETDTMPNWAGSCWYFIAFALAQKGSKEIKSWDKSLIDRWLPVDWYLGGAEHAVLHLLYARFWTHLLYDLQLLGFKEPFLRLRNVGMVLANDHRKMSKSWGNVVNPDEVIFQHGADALRVYQMFMAPFNMEIAWSDEALRGVFRFLKRVYQIFISTDNIAKSKKIVNRILSVELQKTILKINKDLTSVKFNTCIAHLMKFLNKWEQHVKNTGNIGLSQSSMEDFLKILAPFAPFLTEELWHSVLNKKESIHKESWPTVIKLENLSEETIIHIPIQVNGKLRDIIIIDDGNISENNVVKKAIIMPKVKKLITGKKHTTIYVPGKILNFIFKNS